MSKFSTIMLAQVDTVAFQYKTAKPQRRLNTYVKACVPSVTWEGFFLLDYECGHSVLTSNFNFEGRQDCCQRCLSVREYQ